MANFSASNLVKAQVLLNEDFNTPELRDSPAPVLALGRQNTAVLSPSHTEMRKREDRPIEAYIMTRNKRTTLGGDRTHDHTGGLGDSMKLPIEFTTFKDTFKFSIKWLDNNMFDDVRVLANQFKQSMQNIRMDVEKYYAAKLIAERTQVNTAIKNGVWNATNHAFEISEQNGGRFWQLAKSMMTQNSHRGMYDVIADPVAYADAMFWAEQGKANATNYGFQFSNLNFAESIDLDDPNYKQGTALVLPANSFGVLDWIPKQNRQGWGDYNTNTGGYGTMVDPVSGLAMAIHGYSTRADTSTMNGSKQDVVLEFEVSVDLAMVLAPLSTPSESVVFEVAQTKEP